MLDLTPLAAALVMVVAGYLFMSAATKAASPYTATVAMTQFGLGDRAARSAVRTSVVVEALAGTIIVLWPGWRLAQALCATLFAFFGVVGAFALLSGRTPACGCMGSLHRSKLGWPQIVQFGLVSVSIAVIARYPPGWGASTALAALFALVVGVSVALLAFAIPAWLRVRRARTSDRIGLSTH